MINENCPTLTLLNKFWSGTITEQDILDNCPEVRGPQKKHSLVESIIPPTVKESEIRRPKNLEEIEKDEILFAIKYCGNKSEAARRLGITIKTLYNKLEKYNYQEPNYEL